MAKIILDSRKLLGTDCDGRQVGTEKVGDNKGKTNKQK